MKVGNITVVKQVRCILRHVEENCKIYKKKMMPFRSTWSAFQLTGMNHFKRAICHTVCSTFTMLPKLEAFSIHCTASPPLYCTSAWPA